MFVDHYREVELEVKYELVPRFSPVATTVNTTIDE